MALKFKRFNKIIAFEKQLEQEEASVGYVAYHSENMEVASISKDIFGELSLPQTESFREELEAWNGRVSSQVFESQSHLTSQNKIKSLNINVTQICNLHCIYCAAGGDGTYGDPIKSISIDKTLPQLKFFMDKLNEGERFHISFLGGEPLLYAEGIDLICEYVLSISKIKNLQVTFKITTNGTLWNEVVESLLKKYKPTLAISMDGSPEINDQLRPQKNGKSSSQAVLSTLRQLQFIRKEIGIVGVHSVFSSENMSVTSAYNFFYEFNFDFMDFMYSVTDENTEANRLYIQEMEKVADLAWQRGGERELRKIYIFDHYFDLLDEQRRLENHCGIGKTLAVIDSRNRIYNCPWTVGRPQDQIGDKTEIFSDRVKTYGETVIERNNCQTCWARYLCGGGCSFVHNTTDNKNNMKKSEFYCDRIKYIVGLSIYYFSKSRELMT